MSRLIAVGRDLMSLGRARGAAAASKAAFASVPDSSALSALVQEGDVVVVDLHEPGIDAGAVVTLAVAAGARVVAHGSHVDADRLRMARDAGAEAVPNSAAAAAIARALGEARSGATA